MSRTRAEQRKYKYYICGQCNTPIEYLASEEPPIPCPDCSGDCTGYKSTLAAASKTGWVHGTRDKRDIPEDIKYPIK